MLSNSSNRGLTLGSSGKTSIPAEESCHISTNSCDGSDSMTHLTGLQSSNESLFIDHSSSSGIYQNRPLLHLIKLRLPKASLCLIIQRQVERDNIRSSQQLILILDVFALKVRLGRDGISVVINDLHIECNKSFGQSRSNTSHSDDSDSTSFWVGSGFEALFPFSRSDVLLCSVELSKGGNGEESTDGGCCVVDCFGGVGDLNTSGSGGCYIDWDVSTIDRNRNRKSGGRVEDRGSETNFGRILLRCDR